MTSNPTSKGITIGDGLAWRYEGDALVTLTPGECAQAIERLTRERDDHKRDADHTRGVLRSAERDYQARIEQLHAALKWLLGWHNSSYDIANSRYGGRGYAPKSVCSTIDSLCSEIGKPELRDEASSSGTAPTARDGGPAEAGHLTHETGVSERDKLVAAVNRLCPHRGDMPAGMYEEPCPKCLAGDSAQETTAPRPFEPFVVKHYSEDERPSIKGNGFDGLEIGADRKEAQHFIDWINARLAQGPSDKATTDGEQETLELPESLRDPLKVMERGRELLAAWGPTPITDAALAAPARRPCDWPDNHVQPCDCSANEPPPKATCEHKRRLSEASQSHVTYEVCADCGHRFI